MDVKASITMNGKKYKVVLSQKGFSRTCYIGTTETPQAAQALAINGTAAARGSLEAFDLLPEVGQKNIREWGEWEVKKNGQPDERADAPGR